MNAESTNVLAISGGVGGAKLALGLANVLPAGSLTIVCNTGDDFDHLGLRICPDLDTVMYTLSGQSNPKQGWGLENESWQVMARLRELNGEDWFNLGDKDLATHLIRTQLLAGGRSLTDVTALLCEALGIKHRIIPMSDGTVSTKVHTADETLNFQHYFVREQCAPKVTGFTFDGIDTANPQALFSSLLQNEILDAVIICPSNPYVSIDPVIGLPGIRDQLKNCSAPVIAVSPIIGSKAIKGPTAKMMSELNIELSALSIARYYSDFVDGYVIDDVDKALLHDVRELGIEAIATNTLMTDISIKISLAEQCLAFARSLVR